jgi:hypothetical protein
MDSPKHKPTKIFVSYSHSDKEWLQRLKVHLRPLERDGLIECWDDTQITSGQKWGSEIEQTLQSAKVAVLLISADFLASEFIMKNELPPLLVRAKSRGVTILPLIISPCRFEQTKSLSEFQAVNSPSRTLLDMTKVEQEKLFQKTTEEIHAVLTLAPLRDLQKRVEEELRKRDERMQEQIIQIIQDPHLSESDKEFLRSMVEAFFFDLKRAMLDDERENVSEQKLLDFIDHELQKLKIEGEILSEKYNASRTRRKEKKL